MAGQCVQISFYHYFVVAFRVENTVIRGAGYVFSAPVHVLNHRDKSQTVRWCARRLELDAGARNHGNGFQISFWTFSGPEMYRDVNIS